MINDDHIRVIKGCKKDKTENTLDDLIKGLQKLRAEHGNVRLIMIAVTVLSLCLFSVLSR